MHFIKPNPDKIKAVFYLVIVYCVFSTLCCKSKIDTKTGEQKNKIEPQMVWVEGGNFNMGSTDGAKDEAPVHSVDVAGFWIGKYEVTESEWNMVMQSGSSDTASFPAIVTSREEVTEFIAKLDSITGKKYRLPTEAEWEYAARGGIKSKGYKYCGSNNIDEVGWYFENSNNTIHNVGLKKANELGIFDMCGNVWELCSDWYDENYYRVSPKQNPKGVVKGPGNSARGGSCIRHEEDCRDSFREWSSELTGLGFRLALDK